MKLLFFLFLGVGAWSVAAAFDEAANNRNRELLRRAMATSAKASYMAEIDNPDPVFSRLTRGVFYRRVDGGGNILRRAELYEGNALREVYLSNPAGQFGMGRDGAVQVTEIPILAYPDLLFADFHQREWDFSIFDLEEVRYDRQDCLKLTMKVPDYVPSFVALISGVYLSEAEDPNHEIYSIRPFTREFIIDRDSEVILSRTHYNSHKKKIHSQSLGKVQLGERPDLSLFATPETVVAKVNYRHDFLDLNRPNPPPEAAGWTDHTAFTLRRFGEWLISPAFLTSLGRILGALGAVLIAAAVFFKLRLRRAAGGRRRRR